MLLLILTAFLAPVLHALSCILDAHFSNDVFTKPSALIFYATLSNVIVIPFLFLFGSPEIPSASQLVIISIISLIDVFYQLPYYVALKKIDTSVTVALFSLGKISVPVLAYLIVDERLSALQYFGFGIILSSGFLLNFDWKRFKVNIAFFLMLGVSLLLSAETVLEKYCLGGTDFITLVFWMSLFSTAMSAGLLCLEKVRKNIAEGFPEYKKTFPLFIGNEILTQGGTLAAIDALSGLPVLVMETIEASQSIFTLLFGFVLYAIFGDRFKEKLAKREVVKKMLSFTFIILGSFFVLR